MSRYSALPDHVREALGGIVPSGDDELWYFPCRVTLRDGRIFDTVYIEPELPYLRWWGVYPEDDRGKRFVKIEDVVKVEDSPTRLPARFANQVYDHGESGMGYTIFTIVFSDGERQACITGGAVDFIRYPNGKGPNDVSSVLPHEGGRNAEQVGAPDWYWCLYSGEPFRPTRTAVQMFGGLSSITETLTVENHIIRYHMHWLIFKRRLGDLVREGKARQIPPPDGVCGRGYEWYLDVATGDVYRYGPPSPSAISEWMTAEPREIDSEKLNSVEMADRSGKNDMVIRRFMISLGDAGLVLSQRGSRGGWMLARDPKTITLEDIYRAVVRRPFIADSRKRSIPRVSQRLDRELRAVIDAASDTGLARLANVSLADIA